MRRTIHQPAAGNPAPAPKACSHTRKAAYRFAFNGQEKDDEVFGSPGTSMTAEYWQYDTRTGRRWNLDPVVKPWQSGYSTLSCSPISLIDPKGDTDYYNLKGKKIGTDGIVNGARMLVLSKPTAKAISKSSEQKQWETVYTTNIVPSPTIAEVDAMKNAWTKTQSGRDTPHDHEEGFLSGGGLITPINPGPSSHLPTIPHIAKQDLLDALDVHTGQGASVGLFVHTHMWQTAERADGKGLDVMSPGPSGQPNVPWTKAGDGDFQVMSWLQENYGTKWSAVVASDYNQGVYTNGTPWATEGPPKVTFYTAEKSVGSVRLKQLDKAVRKIEAP